MKALQFIVCSEPDQIRAAQQLRFEVFCLEKAWVDSRSCEDGIETDSSDSVAIHFLALDDDMPVGTVRLLLGWRQPLPAAVHLDLDSLNIGPAEMVEVSRLATKRTGRSQNLRIFLGLTSLMWEWATQNSAKVWLAIADEPLYYLLTRLGLPVVAEGDPVEYLGSRCIPVAFDMPGTGLVLKSARRS